MGRGPALTDASIRATRHGFIYPWFAGYFLSQRKAGNVSSSTAKLNDKGIYGRLKRLAGTFTSPCHRDKQGRHAKQQHRVGGLRYACCHRPGPPLSNGRITSAFGPSQISIPQRVHRPNQSLLKGGGGGGGGFCTVKTQKRLVDPTCRIRQKAGEHGYAIVMISFRISVRFDTRTNQEAPTLWYDASIRSNASSTQQGPWSPETDSPPPCHHYWTRCIDTGIQGTSMIVFGWFCTVDPSVVTMRGPRLPCSTTQSSLEVLGWLYLFWSRSNGNASCLFLAAPLLSRTSSLSCLGSR